MVAVTGVLHWHTDPEAWDRITLGGVTLPGVWTVNGALSRRLDIKDPKGADGGRIKDEGYQPANIDISGRFIDQLDFFEFQQVFPKIHPRKKGAGRDAFTISHPALQLVSIQFVYVQEIGIPFLEAGILNLRIRLVEWVPGPKKKKKGKGKPESSATGQGSTELDGVEVPDSIGKLTNLDLP